MLDVSLIKELTELIGNNLTSPEIELVGAYFFKNYDTHSLEGISKSITISPHRASKRLVQECVNAKKALDLLAFTIELDSTSLNGRMVRLAELDKLLHKLSRSGFYFDFTRRKLIKLDESSQYLKNWGVLREGREYAMIVASVDICENSKLVKKYKSSIIEKEYHNLLEFMSRKLYEYDGRTWFWAGDGGIFAFRDEEGPAHGVSCCLEILSSLSIYNCLPKRCIEEKIAIRIGMDGGKIKYFSNTGRIISDAINYASHLQQEHTMPGGLSVSQEVYKRLSPPLQCLFKHKKEFEGRPAYSLVYNCEKAFQ
jgi:class 3 adenylate cyclase